MDLTLAKPVIQKQNPDLIVVHGDRVETLRVHCRSLNNILVAHIEGGELSER
jgi:UDP-N-acetylglucosamine 2-epimerase (hydrolysing)